MEIKLSKPDLFFDKHIEKSAAEAGCAVNLKWFDNWSARFVLVQHPTSKKPASYAAHDSVIRKLFDRDPDAKVRTAIAIYQGRDDFENQKVGGALA